MAFGLDTTGFTPKTLDDLKTELESAFKSRYGESIDVSPQSVLGQMIGVLADRLFDLWSLGGGVYSAFTPDGASGVALDDVCAITGTLRKPATYSTTALVLGGVNGTVVPAGSVITVTGTGTRFVTTAPATLSSPVLAWAGATAYAAGAVRFNGANVYMCTSPGTSSVAPTGTTTFTDGALVWKYLWPYASSGSYQQVAARAESTGPKVAAAFSLSNISVGVAGWNVVTNYPDAVLGADIETDAALRLRREAEIRTAGKASIDAIRAALLEVPDVTSANVFENSSDVTDANGLPPHSIECLVRGGTDAAVAASIFDEKAAGIATYGLTTVSVTDSQGFAHNVLLTRPTEIPIYVIYNLTVDALNFPLDGAAQVTAALVTFGDAQKVGKDAVDASILAQAFQVAGVLDGVALIGTAPTPTLTANIVISTRQIATFDTSRITVNVVGGIP